MRTYKACQLLQLKCILSLWKSNMTNKGRGTNYWTPSPLLLALILFPNSSKKLASFAQNQRERSLDVQQCGKCQLLSLSCFEPHFIFSWLPILADIAAFWNGKAKLLFLLSLLFKPLKQDQLQLLLLFCLTEGLKTVCLQSLQKPLKQYYPGNFHQSCLSILPTGTPFFFFFPVGY